MRNLVPNNLANIAYHIFDLKKIGYVKVCLMVCLFSLISCRPSEVDKETLIKYIVNPENGLLKTYDQSGIVVKASYRPTEFFLIAKMKSNPTSDLDSLNNEFGHKLFFTLDVSVNGQEIENTLYSAPGDFGKKIETLSFGMKPYLFASNAAKDTIPVLSYHYERTFGMKNSTTFLLAFDRKKIMEEEKIDINVSMPLINLENVTFSFLTSDIEKVPSLKIK